MPGPTSKQGGYEVRADPQFTEFDPIRQSKRPAQKSYSGNPSNIDRTADDEQRGTVRVYTPNVPPPAPEDTERPSLPRRDYDPATQLTRDHL